MDSVCRYDGQLGRSQAAPSGRNEGRKESAYNDRYCKLEIRFLVPPVA
jgi:hypothetical protein